MQAARRLPQGRREFDLCCYWIRLPVVVAALRSLLPTNHMTEARTLGGRDWWSVAANPTLSTGLPLRRALGLSDSGSGTWARVEFWQMR